jgi:hypothetical protein
MKWFILSIFFSTLAVADRGCDGYEDFSLTVEQLFDDLSRVDSSLTNLRNRGYIPGEAPPAEYFAQLEAKDKEAAYILDALSQLSEEDLLKKQSLRREINSLNSSLATFWEPKRIVVKPKVATENSIKEVAELGTVQANKPYILTTVDSTHPWEITFSDPLLKELKRIDGAVKAAFLRAIQHGPSSASMGENGIKILKTQDKVRFVEIKPVGSAGALRIYGCIEGAQIALHFVGEHMQGHHSEHQRNKIRTLCK